MQGASQVNNMKHSTYWRLSPGLLLALIPLLAGSEPDPNVSPLPNLVETNQEPAVLSDTLTNAPSSEAAEQQLESAPGQIVSTPPSAPENVALSGPAQQLVRLAQAGVNENVMLAFVTNSSNTFDLSADAIIYLNDLGVPGTVVTAMIQHDQVIRTASFNPATGPTSPTGPGVPVPAADTNAIYPPPDSGSTMTDSTVPPGEMTTDMGAVPEQYGTSTYFYDSLSPYGNWINIAGYGLCWQPTACVMNRGWQPYCNNGYWVYSNCGWYWASDYSWGWAPFHYGRWFRHNRWGWCWAPDTVWGPSWVSWRYTSGYCGWAPLPPTACFNPGAGAGFTCFGRPVGFGFGFGLASSSYTFVPTGSLYGRRPMYYRVPTSNVNRFFNHTVVVNQMVQGNNQQIINKGIPVNHVAAAIRAGIPTVRINDTADPGIPRAGRISRNGTLAVYRPNLPLPARPSLLAGQGVGSAPRQHVLPHEVRSTGTEMARSDSSDFSSIVHGVRAVAPSTINNQPYHPAKNSSSGNASVPPNNQARAVLPRTADLQSGVSSYPRPHELQPAQRNVNVPVQPALRTSPWSPAGGAAQPSRAFNNSPAVRPGPSLQPRTMVPAAPRAEIYQTTPGSGSMPVQRNSYNAPVWSGYRQNNTPPSHR